MDMSEPPSPGPWSTVAALPDYLLLAQTRQLARHEQALQILVLDHLREIEARGLHLTRGYGSLFDYVVRELGYTAAAAWRRIKAMRLCSATNGARELLQDGKLNLSNAAQLQNLFERSDRGHGRGRPPGGQGSGGGPGGEPRNDGAAGEPAPEAPMRAGGGDPAPGAAPVLDAAAREELVKRAAGKSTREVQQMVAEVDPELARPNDRMRALGDGRWELKATIDAECRHGLEKLQMLLSHTDPHLTLGGLVARLVRDGLDRYDPARPPRVRRSGSRSSASGERSASTSARPDTEAVPRNVARAKGGAVELRSEIEPDDVSGATVRGGAPHPSAAKRPSETEPVGDRARQRVTCGDTEQRQAHHFADEAPVRSGTSPRVACGGVGRRQASRFRGDAAYGGRERRRGTRGGTKQRRPHHFADETPIRSGTSPRGACGGAGRRQASRFRGEAAYGGRERWRGTRGGIKQRRPHHFADETPIRSGTRSRGAGGGAGRWRAGGFAAGAACGGRARQRGFRGRAWLYPPLRFGAEASRTG